MSRVTPYAVLALVASACNCGVQVDPEGYACDLGGVCPQGYQCLGGVCHAAQNGCAQGCNQAPAAVCSSATSQTVFDTPGSCVSGQCQYPSHERTCAMGCTGDTCLGDPCDGVSCTTPPAGTCKDANTLTASVAPGTCSNGSCSYPTMDVACSQGCTAGQCRGQNLCQNVSCATPPANACMGNSARIYASSGTCDTGSGSCHYDFTDTPCLVGCSAGRCLPTMLNFSQTMPRVRFGVRALDLAPSSSGATALVVGANGAAMKWNGTAFTPVATNTTETLNAVWFSGPTTAWAVGSNRTVLHYVNGAFQAVSGTTFRGSANLVAVHGLDDTQVVVASDDGAWSLLGGGSWAGGDLTTSFSYQTRAVQLDPMGHVRIAGACDGTPCVAYRSGSGTWYEDTDTGSDPFNALGPAPTTSGTVNLAWVGRSASAEVREHDGTAGTFTATALPALAGSGVWGLTGAVVATVSRPVFILTDQHLYRYASGMLDPPLADLYLGDQALSPNESAGVLVAESNRAQAVNDLYHRGPGTDELLDLGEDWAAATSMGTSVAWVSRFGDVAVKGPAESVFHFRRGSFVNVADAAGGPNGLLVVGASGAVETVTSTGFTQLSSGTTADLHGVCRVSDSEAYAVGAGGVILGVNFTAGTVSPVTSPTTDDLFAVDCPSPGNLVACGANGTVVVLQAGKWTKLEQFPGNPSLSSCRLLGRVAYAAGDNVFGQLDSAQASPQWQALPAAAGLQRLVLLGTSDAYALSGSRSITHYDGTSWSPRFTLSGQGSLVGGGQLGGKVVYAGSLGVVVESQ